MTHHKERGSVGAWVLGIIIIVIVIWAIYYFAHGNQSSAPAATTPAAQTQTVPASDQTSTPAPTTQAPVQNLTVKIDIKNFAFSPTPLTVKAGTTVIWTNEDSVPHTVTSDSGSTLNSPRLSQGQTYSVTFSAPGTYAYHCAVHPMMKGTVVVQ